MDCNSTTRDHLGSSTVTMDANGATLVNLSFAAFGARRGAGWNDVPSSGDWSQITATHRKGFTGHEMLDSVAAIHMNGRVYDEKLGRFLSADPVWTGNLADPQSLNPYSYVQNRPLSLIDPSGFNPIGDIMTNFAGTNALDGSLLQLEAAIAGFQRRLGRWAEACKAGTGPCSAASIPSVAGINAAVSGVIGAGNNLMRSDRERETIREENRRAKEDWQTSREYWQAKRNEQEARQSRKFWDSVRELERAGPLLASNKTPDLQFSSTELAKTVMAIYENGRNRTRVFSRVFGAKDIADISFGLAETNVSYGIRDINYWRGSGEHYNPGVPDYLQIVRWWLVDWRPYERGGPPQATLGNFLQDVMAR